MTPIANKYERVSVSLIKRIYINKISLGQVKFRRLTIANMWSNWKSHISTEDIKLITILENSSLYICLLCASAVLPL